MEGKQEDERCVLWEQKQESAGFRKKKNYNDGLKRGTHIWKSAFMYLTSFFVQLQITLQVIFVHFVHKSQVVCSWRLWTRTCTLKKQTNKKDNEADGWKWMRDVCWNGTRADRYWVSFFSPCRGDMDSEGEAEKRRKRVKERKRGRSNHVYLECKWHLKQAHKGVVFFTHKPIPERVFLKVYIQAPVCDGIFFVAVKLATFCFNSKASSWCWTRHLQLLLPSHRTFLPFFTSRPRIKRLSDRLQTSASVGAVERSSGASATLTCAWVGRSTDLNPASHTHTDTQPMRMYSHMHVQKHAHWDPKARGNR